MLGQALLSESVEVRLQPFYLQYPPFPTKHENQKQVFFCGEAKASHLYRLQ